MTNKIIQEASARIATDFSDGQFEFLGLRFLSANDWHSNRQENYPENFLACFHGEHSFLITDLEAQNTETLCCKIASVLQDDAMDELNTPWPALQINEEFLGVLEPKLDSAGFAVWTCKGFSCPIGQLQN